jgi:23S rRNA pseudouridine1911/1915/1917 synthase
VTAETRRPPGQWGSEVDESAAGRRLDRWLVEALPELSRMRIKALIDRGDVRVDGRSRKAAHRLRGGERVQVEIPASPTDGLEPESIPLDIVFEDDHVLVVNKPAGMVTHPGAGQLEGTLAAAVLAHAPAVAAVGSPRRPGVVHRLDKGTSGLIALAKTPEAYASLTSQLVQRDVSRRYVCLVHGLLGPSEGRVDVAIGRDPRSRIRMAVAAPGRGKRAVTRFRVLERFPVADGGITYLECRLETGRTHQIRVHLASLGHPVVGDRTYGHRQPSRDPVLERLVANLDGVALHAAGLRFDHPITHAPVDLMSPLPARIGRLLAHLRQQVIRTASR